MNRLRVQRAKELSEGASFALSTSDRGVVDGPVTASTPSMGIETHHDLSRIDILNAQAKLQVGHARDEYEQEADSAADTLAGRMQVPSGSYPRIATRIHAGNAAEGEDAPPHIENVVGSTGRPLDSDTRQTMESGFGYDFGRVRIHTGDDASASARAISARAYTIGSDVVFSTGQYAPDTVEGRRLIAHELSHVVQQGRSASLHGGRIQRDADDDLTNATSQSPAVQLDEEYRAALNAGDWQTAAEKLNDFNREDIQSRLARLTPQQIASLHQGALDNPRVGPNSQIALMTESEASPSPSGDLASAGMLGPTPGLPGGPPGGFDPNVVDPEVFRLPKIVEPFPVGPVAARGVTVAAEGGTVAGEVGTAVAVGGSVGAATVTIVIVGGMVVGAALAIGVPYVIERSARLGEEVDQDEIKLPGGAPPQQVPIGDGDAGAPPALAPGTPQFPTADPNTSGPATLPGAPTDGPAKAAPDPKVGDPSRIIDGPPPPQAMDVANKIPGAPRGPDVWLSSFKKPGEALEGIKKTVVIDGANHIGGDVFGNFERYLPWETADGKPITYQEYDIDPYQQGTNRGKERIVLGGGRRYYTYDHYKTFIVF